MTWIEQTTHELTRPKTRAEMQSVDDVRRRNDATLSNKTHRFWETGPTKEELAGDKEFLSKRAEADAEIEANS